MLSAPGLWYYKITIITHYKHINNKFKVTMLAVLVPLGPDIVGSGPGSQLV